MAIESKGYPGLLNVPAFWWARLQWGLGRRYFVYDQDAVRVTPVAAGTRQVSISAGFLGAWGVVDYNTAAFVLQLPVVESGTRWFMIVARRTWGTINATTFEFIDAGLATPTTLPTRNVNFGEVDDQPLALVPLTAGNTVPGTPIDLRVMGTDNGPVHARSELALQYLATLGMEVQIGTTTWRRVLNTAGTGHVWEKDPGAYGRVLLPVYSQAAVLVTQGNWTGASLSSEATPDGNDIELNLELLLRSGTITADSVGGLADIVIANVNAPYRPPRIKAFSGMVLGGATAASRGSYSALFRLGSNGNLVLSATQPNVTLHTNGAAGNPDGDYTISCQLVFKVRTAT